MAYYAFLDKDNIVTEVIVGIDETETIDGLDPETWYGNFRGQVCKRTSYNKKIRGNYAGIGFTYLPLENLFMPAKCHTEAILDAEAAKWVCDNPEHNVNTIGA
jgi:hypothetical protein